MITPVQFAENIFQLNGAPLSLPYDTMRHLHPIYNKPSSAVLLKFGRQTHKSTTVAFRSVLPCVKYGNFNCLYIAPTGNQVSVFSTDKLNSAIRESTIIKDNYFNPRMKDQISFKEFANNSKYYLRSAFHTADSIRGISADQTAIDELQDILSDHISVIEQTASHSLAKWEHLHKINPTLPEFLYGSRMYAGTPKSVDNTLEIYWNKSTQNEWVIKCLHCGKYNYINEYNIGPEFLVCNKCGLDIDYSNGQWISMNPGSFLEGYRVPQIIVPWVNNRTNKRPWQVNVIQTRSTYSAEKFYNEVLALPYAAARHPISEMELKACCEDYPCAHEDTWRDHPIAGKCHNIFAGIDWGKGDTACGTSYSILTLGCYWMDKFRIIFAKKYTGRMSEAVAQVEDMLRIIGKFQATLVFGDSGDGRTSNALMVRALGANRFGEVYEHGTLKQKLKWDKNKGLYLINRSRMITDRIMNIKKQEVSFFNWQEFQVYKSDFTSIYSEYSEITRMSRYDHLLPDDFFHSFLFCYLATGIFRGEFSRYLSGGQNEGEIDDSDNYGKMF